MQVIAHIGILISFVGCNIVALKERKYRPNQTVVKTLGPSDEPSKIKVVTLASLRTAGIEDDADKGKRCRVNDEKLAESVRRAKSKIFEIAFCNPWQWFFTGTLDPGKFDRTDLDTYHKTLTQWIRDCKKATGADVKFLLIPELHKDGKSWHMHGFLMGLPPDKLRQFRIGDRMGQAVAEKVAAGDAVYDWPAYRERFGWCDLEPIRSAEAVSKYITKYISKGLAQSVKEMNAHLYYRSRGLREATEVARGSMSAGTLTEPSYVGDYASVWWLDYSPDLLQSITDSIT